MSIVYYNSSFINRKDLIIVDSNRSFNYGDGLFETIKIINSSPFNFSSHIKRLLYSCRILKISFFEDKETIFNILNELIKKNDICNGSVKIHISRAGGGRYNPESNDYNILISSSEGDVFIDNESVSVCVFRDELKTKYNLSTIKSSSALIPILASIYAKENSFNNALLLNTENNIVEATNSNIFIFKKDTLHTPPITDGCVAGTMRDWIIRNYNVIETSIAISDLEKSSEVFMCNAINGIIAIKSIYLDKDRSIIYRKKYAQIIQKRLISLSEG